jgi:hypothetical protein
MNANARRKWASHLERCFAQLYISASVRVLCECGVHHVAYELDRAYSGVVCHSQALAKYAKPFVSDLLSWHERHSRAGSPQTELNVSASCPRALPAPFFISHSVDPHSPSASENGRKRKNFGSQLGSDCYAAATRRMKVNDDAGSSPR